MFILCGEGKIPGKMLEMTVELERSRHLMNGVRTLKVMSEAQFLAGEDARGVLVMMEPETALSACRTPRRARRARRGWIRQRLHARTLREAGRKADAGV